MPDFYIDSNSLQDDSDATWNSSTLSFLDTAEYLAAGSSGDGDEVWYADNHLEQHTSTETLYYYDNSIMTSVNSTTNQASRGAIIQTTTASNILVGSTNTNGGVAIFSGIDFVSGNNFDITITGMILYMYDCKIEITSASNADTIDFSSDGNTINFINGELKIVASSGRILVGGGTLFQAENLTLTCSASAQRAFWMNGGNGGGTVKISNSDLSNCSFSSALFDQTTDADDVVNVICNRVKIGNYQLYNSGVRSSRHMYFYSTSADDGYYNKDVSTRQGDSLVSTSVYRIGGSYYKEGAPTTSNFSVYFEPNDKVMSYLIPLEIELISLEMDLTSVNTLTFQLAFGDDSIPVDTFTNAEAWIKLVQNDATDLALGVTVESKPATITTTPTDLTSSSETWTGLTHANTDKRQIAIDTVAVPTMTNGQVTAYLCIAKYVSTLEIFGCAKPDVT